MANVISVSAPAPHLLAGTTGLIKTAPAPLLTAAMSWPGDSSTVRVPAAVAPAPTLSSTASSTNGATMALRAPTALLTAILSTPQLLRVLATAPVARLSAHALTGQVAIAVMSAPAPTLAMTGYPANRATMALVAPPARIVADLQNALAEAYRTWVLNTRKGALSEYGPEFAFNSYAIFNGYVVAAGDDGLVVLGLDDTDNGDDITARVRTGKDSFGASVLKRVPRIYAGLSSDGDMLFRTITTEGGQRTYSLPFNGVTGIQQRRVPIGRGPKSRYWQWEIENVEGADFAVDDILVMPTALRRRVQ